MDEPTGHNVSPNNSMLVTCVELLTGNKEVNQVYFGIVFAAKTTASEQQRFNIRMRMKEAFNHYVNSNLHRPPSPRVDEVGMKTDKAIKRDKHI